MGIRFTPVTQSAGRHRTQRSKARQTATSRLNSERQGKQRLELWVDEETKRGITAFLDGYDGPRSRMVAIGQLVRIGLAAAGRYGRSDLAGGPVYPVDEILALLASAPPIASPRPPHRDRRGA